MADTIVLDGEADIDLILDGEAGVFYRAGNEPQISPLNVSSNGTYTAEGDGYNPVVVEVPGPDIEALSITENGIYSAEDCDGYNPITVNISSGLSVNIQEVTITEDFEGTSALELVEHLTEKYPWWDGTKWFMVLEHQWKSGVYPGISNKLVYLHGFATGWGGTSSLVVNSAATNNNLSSRQVVANTNYGTYHLVAGDKYLVVG